MTFWPILLARRFTVTLTTSRSTSGSQLTLLKSRFDLETVLEIVFFYRPDAVDVAEPTPPERWRKRKAARNGDDRKIKLNKPTDSESESHSSRFWVQSDDAQRAFSSAWTKIWITIDLQPPAQRLAHTCSEFAGFYSNVDRKKHIRVTNKRA